MYEIKGDMKQDENFESLNLSNVNLDNTKAVVDKENEKIDNKKKTKKDALEIINNGDVVFFFKHLEEFTWLDKQVLRTALKKCKSEKLYRDIDHNFTFINLDYFEGQVLDNNIANFLLDTNRYVFFDTLVLNLDKTDWLDESIWNKIILNICKDEECLRLASDFIAMSHKIKCPPRQFIKKFINNWRLYNTKGIWKIIFNNLKNMKWLSKSDYIYTIDELLKWWFVLDIVKSNIDNLTYDGSISRNDVLLKLIYDWYSKEIFDYMWPRAITWLDKKEILKLIETWHMDTVVAILHGQKDLDDWIAIKLIDEWYIKKVSNCLNSFNWLSKTTAKKLINEWYVKDVANALKSFVNLDNEIALIMIENWFVKELLCNLKQFEILDWDIANKLVENWYWQELLKNLHQFEKLNKETVLILINNWFASEVAHNLINFDTLDWSVAIKLIELWFWYEVINNIDTFKWFDRKMAENYIRFNERTIH